MQATQQRTPTEQKVSTDGRRERKKRATVARLREAAFEIFSRDGYQAAKIKDIAELADVAERTLFNYATDKRDLLALIFAEDFYHLAKGAFPKSHRDEPLCGQLVHEFNNYSAYFRKMAPVSGVLFREGIWYDYSPQLSMMKDARHALRENLEEALRHKQAEGGLGAGARISDVSAILIAVFMSNLRDIKSSDGARTAAKVRDAARQFGIVLTGIVAEAEIDYVSA